MELIQLRGTVSDEGIDHQATHFAVISPPAMLTDMPSDSTTHTAPWR